MEPIKLVIVTGLSGSGKSTVIKALEDIDFFCVDNLPLTLLDGFLGLCKQDRRLRRVAVVTDVREMNYLGSLGDIVKDLKARDIDVDLIFLDAKDDVLLRRFSATRRKHPLEGPNITTLQALQKERRLLEPLKDRATWLIDTSSMTVHQLKRTIQTAYRPDLNNVMKVTILSFGYSKGIPEEADYVFDCRFLPNPFFIDSMRDKTGLDEDVRAYVVESEHGKRLIEHAVDLLSFVLPLHAEEGRPCVTVAFGCTGGRHRSVAVASEVANYLKQTNYAVTVIHRDIPTEER